MANDLERILYGRRSAPGITNSSLLDHVPKDKDRNLPLLQIKEAVRRMEDVVLSDEFDALAKERADTAEHGELKPVVNAFL
ncbi:hypothetical protein [Nitrosomonas eutropha]|uniref:hypothetical protein n=1 Tax=Nitrosomonas eutropha TaxID=916 RepID=UPI0002F60248|nr:hypothetical protein [Nitrosomonas eutropha]